jgi:hypothetical protein
MPIFSRKKIRSGKIIPLIFSSLLGNTIGTNPASFEDMPNPLHRKDGMKLKKVYRGKYIHHRGRFLHFFRYAVSYPYAVYING